MNNTQTSIEWLIEQMQNNIHHTIKIPNEYVEQAKEMHRKETIEAFEMGRFNIDDMGCGEEYYNETFGGAGETGR